MPNHRLVLCCLALVSAGLLHAQQPVFTRADTLRGSNTPERAWWDVTFYDLHVRIDPADSTVRGWNGISYRVTGRPREMQVDLQAPLEVDSIIQGGRPVRWRRDGNVLLLAVARAKVGTIGTVTIYYHGKPRVAKNPPWDGGLIWAQDPDGAPWISTACQGLGASVWWPTKDIQSDEPDSQRIALTVPDSLQAVANGRLRAAEPDGDRWTTWEWFVGDPINNYDVAAYIGRYAPYAGGFEGERGLLTLALWPLASHAGQAHEQWRQVEPMLRCFEGWFGPYPWYRDGYQLIEAPHLGMEHQSAVAYGNRFGNGYKGKDLSGTGWGLTFDFIVIHESAHEWFGNSITAADVADNWVHESFANYAESLFTECQFGTAAGAAYVRGTRKLIKNDAPIVGPYGVNAEGSGDKYYKGGNMLHTVRQVVHNDSTWRAILRGLNEQFRHKIATGRAIQDYISGHAGVNLHPVFTQYLTTTRVPVFEYHSDGGTLRYRWANVVAGFAMPVRVVAETGDTLALTPTAQWQTTALPAGPPGGVTVDENYYVETRRLDPPVSSASSRTGP
jgi:aminopeptidase N